MPVMAAIITMVIGALLTAIAMMTVRMIWNLISTLISRMTLKI